MSDMADHELKAWESYHLMDDGDDASFDPNYYHSWINCSIVKKGAKFTTVKYGLVTVDVSNKLIRGISKDAIFVHLETFNKIVMQALEVIQFEQVRKQMEEDFCKKLGIGIIK